MTTLEFRRLFNEVSPPNLLFGQAARVVKQKKKTQTTKNVSKGSLHPLNVLVHSRPLGIIQSKRNTIGGIDAPHLHVVQSGLNGRVASVVAAHHARMPISAILQLFDFNDFNVCPIVYCQDAKFGDYSTMLVSDFIVLASYTNRTKKRERVNHNSCGIKDSTYPLIVLVNSRPPSMTANSAFLYCG